MSIDRIIKILEKLQIAAQDIHKWDLRESQDAKALREAIALLRLHPDAQPNEPLTLEELREMKGKPVWLKKGLVVGGWAIALGREDLHYIYFTAWKGTVRFPLEDCGAVWFAYRRPPKED